MRLVEGKPRFGEETMAQKPQVIALEEHYLDPEVKQHIAGMDRTGGPRVAERLDDVGQGRIAEMDAAGIDIQVLSHGAPSVQKIADAELAIRLARGANDRLAETVSAYPDRFAGFAALPTVAPQAAADELERRDPARLQGRDGAWADQRAVSRRP